MREIKFRAWSPLAREMYKVNSLHFDKEGLSEIVVEVFEVDGVIYSSAIARNLELMQYIGFTDKNGKEVYEGDILQEIFMDKPLERSLWQVVFKDAAFVTGFTVVGNIYENPELVNVK
jgi:uncharacterized phage protein (TIGR01671 family)